MDNMVQDSSDILDSVAQETSDMLNQSQEMVGGIINLIPKIIIGLIQLAILWICIMALMKFLMYINHKYMRKQEGRLSVTKIETISSIIDDVIKYIVVIIGALISLPILGVDPAYVLAGGGIFAILLATTGSTLLSDFINGFFALFEGYYDVGDYIQTKDYEGTVVALGIKSTVLKTPNQNIITIPNSTIVGVINYAKLPYVQFLDVAISYNASIIDVENVINKDLLPKFDAQEMFTVKYLGVGSLGDSSVGLKFEVTSDVDNRYPAQRFFYRECKLIFDEKSIEIPYNQLVVTHINEKNNV